MSAETIKIESGYLAGTIGEELASDAVDFEHDAELLLKFHGIYQQDDRDVRRSRTKDKLPLDYSCMVRASVPGGIITTEQWLALDRVAGLADDKLRLTTRQGVQYHVVYKNELSTLVAGINSSLLTTLGACGDVVRNVMACPLPHPDRTAVIQPVVDEMVARFRPQTESYWELWVDGEKAVSAEKPDRKRRSDFDVLDSIDDIEPIYGTAYLPRKFKIAIAWPGDNCVDIYTNDVGIVPTLTDGTSGELTGFVVLAGGGMGMSHNRPDDTYPLLAQPVAWVPPADLGPVVEAIVTTQRDHGDRDDRSRARLKYLLEAQGIDWLRDQITERTGLTLADPVELPEWEVGAHHGWHDIPSETNGTASTGRGTMTLGLPVPSGKVAGGLRWALKRLVADGVVGELRVTPRQDLLLVGIDRREVDTVENLLRANGVRLASDNSATRNLAIACPALPTCSKALGEAERVLPDVVDRLEKVLADTGNTGLPLRLNMTGCPNGCSRPYAAELGIVGRTKRGYDIFVGGSPAGDRLARSLRADVPL
ncbi:MAG: NADPH-dependent assimilatory sulfite reductase hemoprotein subunit, partial [Ilumatobacter sp.]